jgi:hypothetical protein
MRYFFIVNYLSSVIIIVEVSFMGDEVRKILSDLINLNGWRAWHSQKVQKSLYDNQKKYDKGKSVSGTCEEWIELDEEEMKIQRCEEILSDKVSKFEIPEFISVKQFSEITEIPAWKVYRMIKKKSILADKVKGRWHIFTDVEVIKVA